MLETLLKYPNYLSLGALILSTFFAGTMLQGERIRKEEIREELREIQQLTEQSLDEVAQIQTLLEQEDARLVGEISEAYEVLAALNERERGVRAELEASDRERQRLANQRRRNQQAINNAGRFFSR